ncbi:hypothetical protein DK389_16580 [Methylobacterium durans]|uniref:Pentapeptide MXKDX repeat protein n=2 Tax=Methylobacterium durans TaxID=2202825 RepID=A0A2U8W8P9_9HYPH|nr:hypothetical protein DK389_16580 [Methylobacterium durans]
MQTFAVAAGLLVSLTGASLAQSTAPDSAQKNMNNPGSVKSNSEKAMEKGGMPATTGTATAPDAGMKAGSTMDRGTAPTPAEPTPRR